MRRADSSNGTLVMTLERWIALVFVLFCLVYGYTAFFVMDDTLAPFMRRNPVWPSTFPKLLAIGGLICGMIVLLGLEKSSEPPKTMDIDYRRLGDYKIGQALVLLALMVLYAFALRPAGFLLSTSGFLILGAVILGERRWHVLVPVALVASVGVWWLVQDVLGIFLKPFPLDW